jgi:hypothetical protein
MDVAEKIWTWYPNTLRVDKVWSGSSTDSKNAEYYRQYNTFLSLTDNGQNDIYKYYYNEEK